MKETMETRTSIEDPLLPKKSLFTVYEVAQYFGVTERTIYLWLEHGHLKGEKIVNSMRIPRESILKCRFNSKFTIVKEISI